MLAHEYKCCHGVPLCSMPLRMFGKWVRIERKGEKRQAQPDGGLWWPGAANRPALHRWPPSSRGSRLMHPNAAARHAAASYDLLELGIGDLVGSICIFHTLLFASCLPCCLCVNLESENEQLSPVGCARKSRELQYGECVLCVWTPDELSTSPAHGWRRARI